MKIRLVGGEFYTDGRTDMKKLMDTFRKLANAPHKKNSNSSGSLAAFNLLAPEFDI
jgi:hypothetical protein